MPYPHFTGNCPNNVSRDAKYSIRYSSDGPVAGLRYEADEEEVWLLTTDQHPKLVEMVNGVKLEHELAPNGAFYINEYKQVIVPVSNSQNYYLAGTYKDPLSFEFEGKIISGEPRDLEGKPLSVGDIWIGPHPGIPYILCAGGKDIRYEYSPRTNVIKKVKLSKKIGKDEAEKVAQKIAAVKGYLGGRFYVNEFCSMFAPIQKDLYTQFFYLGKLSLKQWFPKPDAR